MTTLDNRALDNLIAKKRPDLERSVHSIFRHAHLLAPEDRRLLEYAFQMRLSHRTIGQIMHLPGGTITRRIHRLVARLHDPIVIALLDPRCSVVPEYRQLGIEHFLLGHATATLADKHRISAEKVRRILHVLRAWHRGEFSKPQMNADERRSDAKSFVHE